MQTQITWVTAKTQLHLFQVLPTITALLLPLFLVRKVEPITRVKSLFFVERFFFLSIEKAGRVISRVFGEQLESNPFAVLEKSSDSFIS